MARVSMPKRSQEPKRWQDQIQGKTAMKNVVKMPKDALALLTDLAKIRREILENAPQCLPALAPSFVDAEQRIHAMLGN